MKICVYIPKIGERRSLTFRAAAIYSREWCKASSQQLAMSGAGPTTSRALALDQHQSQTQLIAGARNAIITGL